MLACYIKSVSSARWQSLKVGCTVKIEPGDICSLLPDKSWFKVTSNDSATKMNDGDANGKRKTTDSSEDEPPSKKLRSSSSDSVKTIYSQSKDVLDSWDTAKEVASGDLDVEAKNSFSPQSSKIMKETSSSKTQANSSEKGSVENTKMGSDDEETRENKVASETLVTDVPSSMDNSGTNAGSNSQACGNNQQGRDEAGKRIKWDCGRHFSDQQDQPGEESSVVENGGHSSPRQSNDDPNGDVTPDVSEEPPMRNKCAYGSRCYRRNSEHKREFSHPGDEDYDIPDPRPECPFGIRCYRKNPQHKRDFKHTNLRPSRAQTPVRGGRVSDATSGTDQSSAEEEESVDESEYEPSCYGETSDDYRSDFDGWSDVDGVSDYDDK